MGINQYPPHPSPIGEGRNAVSSFTLHLSLKQRVAFTLAEVLITLGVIGVVAALTMPSLIANYQKKVLVTQIKKTYATLNEGFRQIMTSQGCTDMTCAGFLDYLTARENKDLGVQLFAAYSDNLTRVVNTFKLSNVETTLNMNSSLFDYNVSIQGLESNPNLPVPFISLLSMLGLSAYNNYLVSGTLPDGSIIFYMLGGYIYIDVNGQKKPNIVGRDIFGLMLMSDGRVLPFTDYNSWYYYYRKQQLPANQTWIMTEQERLRNLKDECLSSPMSELLKGACLELIIHDGWEMNY